MNKNIIYRLSVIFWKILECIFKKYGFTFERHQGDHRSYVKQAISRPMVIPTYREIDVDSTTTSSGRIERSSCMIELLIWHTNCKITEMLTKVPTCDYK